MLYLIWGLLNVGLLVLLVVVCFKATRFIKQKLGWIAAIIFVFVLLSFMGASNSKGDTAPNSTQTTSWKFTSPDNLEKFSVRSIHVTIQNNLISTYGLGLQYGKDGEQKNVPVSAYSFTQGFVSGTKWIPTAIVVNQTDDNTKFDYEVEGTVEWKFFGMTIYSQSRNLKGTVIVK